MRVCLSLVVALTLYAPGVRGDSSQLFCGHTGFNLNLGVTTKSFRCAPARVTPGLGTVTFTGVATVTVTNNGFANIAPPDALPGADGVFFKTSGLFVLVGSPAQRYMLRVSGKTDASTIAVAAGGAAPAFSGTTTTWSYWNTTCYRTAATYSDFTDGADSGIRDQRIWRHFSELSEAQYGPSGGADGTVYNVGWQQAAGTIVGNAATGWRLQGFRAGLLSSSQAIGAVASAQTYFIAPILNQTFTTRFSEIQFSTGSDTAATYPVQCMFLAAAE